ncbi:MAG: VWA domain-containing protein [Prevotella sp.]|nr:VWA domain-containing protein [Prevotella sp.]
MKTKRNFLTSLAGTLMLATTALTTACSVGDGEDGYFSGPFEMEGSAWTGGGEGSGNTAAGIVTAGEWNDLRNWSFWSGLMASQEFGDKSSYWEFYTNNRVAVSVTDNGGNALAGVSVELLRGDETIWQTKTDNHGEASLWAGLYQQETADSAALQVRVGTELMSGHPSVARWDSVGMPRINHYVAGASTVKPRADIAFIVDATGSMGDEIHFLKSDLVDIIGKAADIRPTVTLRTAALFYRDEGDEYLTRHADFTEKLQETAKFVDQQQADGGDDYPEAVHSALEQMLQKLSWDNDARTRLAFLVLDAPAHHETDVIRSLQRSIGLCAKMGIKLIPVAASGVDKNTEFMLRFFAIATGGTYVFLTNDSGVGGDHIEASVGQYKVEQLNDLLVRLISEYTE